MTANTGAALLAIDNLLGFVGTHPLAAGFVPLAAAISVSAGAVAAVGAAFARDAARLLAAMAACTFVATLSPATSTGLVLPVAIALQALVPLAFAAAGLLHLRHPRSSPVVRVLAVMLLSSAVAWTVTTFVPIALVAFLIAQATTLLVAAALSLHPVFRSSRSLAHELWSSAEVR
ncbi:hypothetical protein [Curtobacterium aurantiacum]|uniref:hypothetical protein n=1 Tax=Curtobacterium aurantiacum TaxID=3236919 RepID=UPI001BE0C954|nr:hypothetical protein [Curtobacterium flaccumfaciens]MBT1674666.1 hypothetical protein [Curtobacterium flaccumfaciens pv. flaccumfaciens]